MCTRPVRSRWLIRLRACGRCLRVVAEAFVLGALATALTYWWVFRGEP